MTKAKTEPERIFVNFLRANLSDVNPTRSGQWIFPDFPRIEDLGDNSFPRIGVTTLSEESAPMGLQDDNQWETLTFQVDVVAKKDKKYSVTVTDEALGTMSSGANSNRMTYENVPGTVANIKHGGTAYTNVTQVGTNGAFTSPASGTVQYAFSTGDLHFSTTDVTDHDGQAITSTYSTTLEGKKLCQYLARNIIKKVRVNWRTDSTLNGLFYPIKVSNTAIPFDEDLGIYRQMIEYRFNMFNAGEGI